MIVRRFLVTVLAATLLIGACGGDPPPPPPAPPAGPNQDSLRAYNDSVARAEAERRRARLILRNRIIYRVRGSNNRIFRFTREYMVELPRLLGRRLLGRPRHRSIYARWRQRLILAGKMKPEEATELKALFD